MAASGRFSRVLPGAQEGRFHGEDFDDHVGEGAHDLLLVGDRCMYFCVAAPAAKSVSFLAAASSCIGGERVFGSRLLGGRTMTSSISFLMAGISGSLPDIARFISQPVMMRRLISLVPSKMRLMRAVAVGALGGVLLDVAVAGEDLQDLVDDHVEHLGGPDFDDGALDGVLLDALLDLARCRRLRRARCWRARASIMPTVR